MLPCLYVGWWCWRDFSKGLVVFSALSKLHARPRVLYNVSYLFNTSDEILSSPRSPPSLLLLRFTCPYGIGPGSRNYYYFNGRSFVSLFSSTAGWLLSGTINQVGWKGDLSSFTTSTSHPHCVFLLLVPLLVVFPIVSPQTTCNKN